MVKLNLQGVPESLYRIKWYEDFGVVKYASKVFYDNLWDKYPVLRMCRGTIVDRDLNVLAYAFRKVFNLGENGTKIPSFPFEAIEKINGFLGVVSSVNGRIVFSTTGTADSAFAKCLETMFLDHADTLEGSTKKRLLALMEATNSGLLFEVVSPDDPHIIKEEPGLYLIGMVNNCQETMEKMHELSGGTSFGQYLMEVDLDLIADKFKFKRPKATMVNCQEEFDALMEGCTIEGYMLRKPEDILYENVVKVKSPFYLHRKFVARAGKAKIEGLWTKSPERLFALGLEEEFIILLELVKAAYTKEQWLGMTEQERLAAWDAEYRSLLRGA